MKVNEKNMWVSKVECEEVKLKREWYMYAKVEFVQLKYPSIKEKFVQLKYPSSVE